MTPKTVVSSLPVFDQNLFPALPQIPDGKALMPFGTSMGKVEREAILSAMVTTAIRKGASSPISMQEFSSVLKQVMPPFLMQNVINEGWKLFEEGYIEIITFGKEDFLVPTATFANFINSADLRIM